MLPPGPALPKGYEHVTPEMCLSCKGARALCGLPCVWLARVDARIPTLRLTSQDLVGSSPPSVFVGRYGYPAVSLGPMMAPVHLPPTQALALEDAPAWIDKRIEDIIGMRSSLLRTRRPIRVRDARQPPKLLAVTQELAAAYRPVDTEVHLTKRPNVEFRARLADTTAPMGPSVEPDRVRLTENPRIRPAVERLTGDVHARAAVAMTELFQAGTSPYQIEKLLSVGLLGHQRDRKVVPTRWSITATDDQLGLALRPRLEEFSLLDQIHYHETVAHGNRFHVFLLPRPWSFDMVETWLKGAMWSLETSPFIEDYEDGSGRRSYASNVTGAYYAARLSVLRHLVRIRRQAAAFVYREITPDYWAPLGVWLIREAVQRALQQSPTMFPDLLAALRHVGARTLRQGWDRSSWLLDAFRTQRSLHDFGAA